MATKDELREQAEALGVAGAGDLNKDELEDAVRGAQAAGPVVPAGTNESDIQFESSGKPIVGVQAADDNDIPEAAR